MDHSNIFQNRQTGSKLILLSNSASFASPSSLLLSVSGWPQSHPSWETPLLNWSFVVAGISYPDVVNKALHSLIAVHNFNFIEKLFLVFRLADLVLLCISCSLRCKLLFFGECAWEKSHADSAVIGCFKRSFRSRPLERERLDARADNISLEMEKEPARISEVGQISGSI